MLSPGFIAWDSIAHIHLQKLGASTYLCLDIHELEAWKTTLNTRQQRLVQANLNMGYSPVRIQLDTLELPIDAQELLRHVRILRASAYEIASHV
ncbi:hypothetical protein KPC83_01995 [Collinsella sp. zg1085]|nr:hypothetical protein KPC83_01995 [Collinsella sp. zg1085]